MANRIMLNETSYHGAGAIHKLQQKQRQELSKSIRLLGSGSDQIRSHRKGDRRS